jgi:hypothetical protein
LKPRPFFVLGAGRGERRHDRHKRRRTTSVLRLKWDGFTADTATKTGKPERTIQRDATPAKALGSDLERVAGTSLDTERRLADEDDAAPICNGSSGFNPLRAHQA